MTLTLWIVSWNSLLGGCVDYEVQQTVEIEGFQLDEARDPLDILWVVDASGSMYEEQAALQGGAQRFMEILTLVSLPFELNMVSMDLEQEEPGALLGETLSQDSEQLVERFLDMLPLEGQGSVSERGFDAAVMAAEPQDEGGSFGRSDARLEVIFFSDEDDQSTLSPAEALSELGSPRPGMDLGVSSIVGDPPEGCIGVEVAADPGFRYHELSALSGGRSLSICSPDYDALMEEVALETLGLQSRFPLQNIPSLSTIEVRVNEALLHQRDLDGWRFDAGSNEVVLSGYAIPPPGAYVEIRYAIWLGLGAEEDSGLD